MSSLGDRLDRLERELSPTETVLAWLETAHAHGSRVSYLQALVTDPPAQPPLESIVDQATSWAERNRSRAHAPGSQHGAA